MARFCLLHGAWHDPSCWDPLIAALAALGHEAVAPDLPLHDPRATVAARVRPAVDALRALDGTDERTVVVGHSLASIYAPSVCDALADPVLVLLCPGSMRPRPTFPFPPAGPDGASAWDPAAAIDVLYPRLDDAAAHALAGRLRPMAPAPDRPPRVDRPTLPTVVAVAEHDEIFAPDAQRAVAERLGAPVLTLPGGHFPMLEDPAGLARVLDGVAADPPPVGRPSS